MHGGLSPPCGGGRVATRRKSGRIATYDGTCHNRVVGHVATCRIPGRVATYGGRIATFRELGRVATRPYKGYGWDVTVWMDSISLGGVGSWLNVPGHVGIWDGGVVVFGCVVGVDCVMIDCCGTPLRCEGEFLMKWRAGKKRGGSDPSGDRTRVAGVKDRCPNR